MPRLLSVLQGHVTLLSHTAQSLHTFLSRFLLPRGCSASSESPTCEKVQQHCSISADFFFLCGSSAEKFVSAWQQGQAPEHKPFRCLLHVGVSELTRERGHTELPHSARRGTSPGWGTEMPRTPGRQGMVPRSTTAPTQHTQLSVQNSEGLVTAQEAFRRRLGWPGS